MSNGATLRASGPRAVLWLVASGSLLFVGSAQPTAPPYAGSWRGTIPVSAHYGLTPERYAEWLDEPREFVIDISEESVASIFYRTKRDRRSGLSRQTGWQRMPLGWTLNRVGEEGVVIYAHDATAAWVETQVFTVASIDRETLLVQWWRVVNNVQLDPTATSSKWAVGGQAEFTRRGRR